MLVDNDVPNGVPTLNKYPHIKFWWYRTMLNFCSIVVAILKIATSSNCSMLGINLGHHYLPTYQIVIMMSWIDSRLWKISTGRHFQNGRHNTTQIQHCPILTPFHMLVDYHVPNWFLTLKKLFNVGNQFGTSLSTHISNCDGIGQCWFFAILWWPFWKWRLLENFQCWESIHDIIIYPMAATIPLKFNIVRF
jgi:hypothetical protein